MSDYKMNFLKCSCGCDEFKIERIIQINGNDDVFEFYCTKCGNNLNINIDDNDVYINETYCESEIDKVEFKNGTIKFEKWVVDGDSEYVISLYRGDTLIADRDFNDEDDAKNCYEKCSAIFLTCGNIEKVSRLFYDC